MRLCCVWCCGLVAYKPTFTWIVMRLQTKILETLRYLDERWSFDWSMRSYTDKTKLWAEVFRDLAEHVLHVFNLQLHLQGQRCQEGTARSELNWPSRSLQTLASGTRLPLVLHCGGGASRCVCGQLNVLLNRPLPRLPHRSALTGGGFPGGGGWMFILL